LLWGISWVNVRIMLDDSTRIIDIKSDDGDTNNDDKSDGKVEHRSLKTKEDIMNYVNHLL
jgi:hypothetical protein